MINFNDVTRENIKDHNLNWLQILDRHSGTRKHVLLNLVTHQPEIDKILYLYKPKYQLLIKKCKNVDLQHCNDPKVFIEYSNDIEDIYANID